MTIKLNQEWKERNNKLSDLTREKLIKNTIITEQNKVFIEGQYSSPQEIYEKGYYRAIAILDELL